MSAIPIIGMGAVCGAGIGIDAGYRAVAAGIDGLSPLDLFDSGLKEAPLCAQIRENLENCIGFKAANKTLALSLLAVREALGVVNEDRSSLRLGVVFATTVAGVSRSELFYRNFLKNPDVINLAGEELAFHEGTALGGEIAARVRAQGIHTLSTACSTGIHAIGMAKRLIERGHYDLCLAVGADALSFLTVRGFSSLTLLDPRGCRPFDRNRAGISLGEGAGAMLLASEKAAKYLSLPISAYVSGWGASADCHHMTAPHPQGKGAQESIRGALHEAGLEPPAIDFVAAHGTGSPDNDIAEITAIKAVFEQLPPFFSMKRTLGHTLAGSGTIESVFAVRAMQKGEIPPSAGFRDFDESIGARPSAGDNKPVSNILKNAFGFGGNNASIVFSRERT